MNLFSWVSKIGRVTNIFSKLLRYELHYLCRTFQPYNSLIFVILLFQSIVLGLGDAQGFFIDQIPNDWTLIKSLDQNIIKIISTSVIAVPTLLIWLGDQSKRALYNKELIEIISRNYGEYVQQKLRGKVSKYVKSKISPQGELRVSLFIPKRLNIFKWRLQMVCGTENISNQELANLSFRLGEGALGYTLLLTNPNDPRQAEVVDVSGSQTYPPGYLPLHHSNACLMSTSLKVVTVIASLQKGSIIGLVAVDSDNLLDYPYLKSQKIHSYVLTWLDENKEDIELLWRAKNRV